MIAAAAFSRADIRCSDVVAAAASASAAAYAAAAVIAVRRDISFWLILIASGGHGWSRSLCG